MALVWLGLVLASAWLERQGGGSMETCLFLRATGHPCPTCGSTRALLALLHGGLGTAFSLNPLVTLAFLAGGPLLALRIAFGFRLRVEAGRGARLLLGLAGLALLAANWAWVLGRG